MLSHPLTLALQRHISMNTYFKPSMTTIYNAMIKSNYTDNQRLINKLSIDWPFTQEEVYTALENEECSGNEDRTFYYHVKSPILQSIMSTVKANIPVLLQEMNEQARFQEVWRFKYKEQILNNNSWECNFVCDKPGYNIGIHTDCRIQICLGMLFFNSFDDADQATTFYTTHSGDNPMRMSSEFGTGWYSANTHDSWHTGGNNTQRNRYAILFSNNLELK